jgi:hypothetical protein
LENVVQPAFEGRGVANHFLALAEEGVGGLDSVRQVVACDVGGEFAAALATDHVGAKGFEVVPEIVFGPCRAIESCRRECQLVSRSSRRVWVRLEVEPP